MKSIAAALSEPITLARQDLRPREPEVLIRLQLLRLAQAKRTGVAPGTAIGAQHVVTFDAFSQAGQVPMPCTAMSDAPLAVSFPLLEGELAMALVGATSFDRLLSFPMQVAPDFPLVEYRDTTMTRWLRITNVELLELPSERDPAFWKATGLATSLEEGVKAITQGLIEEKVLRRRAAAVDQVLLTLAARCGVDAPAAAVRDRQSALFEAWELPRWTDVARRMNRPIDLNRVRAAWLGSATAQSWAVRDLALAWVVATLGAANELDRGAIAKAVKASVPPELGDLGQTGAASLKTIAEQAAWLEVGAQVLKLKCVKFA